MARRSGVRVGRPFRSQKRATDWLASADVTVFDTVAAGGVVFDQAFAFAEPATIVRTRGLLLVKSDQAAADETPMGALGFAVVSDEAAAIGVTAMPTPISEQASELWFVWEPFGVHAFHDAGGDSIVGFQFPFDSKAMRKVATGDTAVVTLENASSLHGLDFWITFRMLVKLHS